MGLYHYVRGEGGAVGLFLHSALVSVCTHASCVCVSACVCVHACQYVSVHAGLCLSVCVCVCVWLCVCVRGRPAGKVGLLGLMRSPPRLAHYPQYQVMNLRFKKGIGHIHLPSLSSLAPQLESTRHCLFVCLPVVEKEKEEEFDLYVTHQ